jgi:GNAT superfamily N-acetyltransferase
VEIAILFTDAPGVALEKAGEFLAAQPVLHNLILSILHARVLHSEPGRYWLATEEEKVVGVVLQSPLTFEATLSPMDARVAEAMVSAIAGAAIALPGVNGDATTAAHFAGYWSERCKVAVTPHQGNRLYEWLEPGETPDVGGRLRRAIAGDRSLMVAWIRDFSLELDLPADDTEVRVDRWLAAGELWLWDDGEAVSMAVGRTPAEDVVRISGVYTPVNKRNRGYAGACVYALSKQMRDAGYRCILYTDLANPTSNSIYRRIGYRAVVEGLRYRFG